MDGPITALQTHDSDWSVHKFIEVNFLKLTDNNQIFRNDLNCFHYHLCTISSQIIECQIFSPYDFLKMNSITAYSMVKAYRLPYSLPISHLYLYFRSSLLVFNTYCFVYLHYCCFPCASVRNNTRAWVPYFLLILFVGTFLFPYRQGDHNYYHSCDNILFLYILLCYYDRCCTIIIIIGDNLGAAYIEYLY